MKLKSHMIYFMLFLFLLNGILLGQSKGGRWQFENNGFDSADWDVTDDTGMLQDQASYNSLSPLIDGNAYLYLDTSEVHDYFKVEDSNDLDFTDEDIGISMWIYPIALYDVHFLINKGRQDSSPKTTNYSLRISRNSWNLEFLIRDANDKAKKVTSSFTIPQNQWTFIAVFYDYNAGKVYMWNDPDNSAIDTLDFNQSIFANNDPLSIGSWFRNDPASPSIKDFEGRIDDVRISGRIQDIFPQVTSIPEMERNQQKISISNLMIYPNPVRESNLINIQFQTRVKEDLTLSIFNVLGQEIFSTYILSQIGIQNYSWNMQQSVIPIQSGIYFIRLEGKNTFLNHKFMVLK